MRRVEDNPYLRWFKLAVWLAVLVDLVAGMVALVKPYQLVNRFNLPWTRDVVWLRFAGLLLLILALTYLGAARDPFRYRINSRLAVLGHLFIAVFWIWSVANADIPHSYLPVGIAATFLAVVLGATYLLMMRHEYLNPEIPEDAAG